MAKSLANYPESYYAASLSLPPAAPALAGSVEADVCVVGGGLAGCSAALALAERGYRVAVVEAQRVAWGA
ncbi:MAG: FAD-dependent oxidoreductase, partial [Steroidobacteraceae bacterium]